MTEKKTRSGQAADLSEAAEELARGKAVRSPRNIEGLSIEGVRQALHDLQVHQVELETQNQELRRTQLELEASRARYWDLYDLAPIGYITVSEKGLILEANLTAATLLGVARADLAKRLFILFILTEDQNIFYHHYKMLSKTGAPQSCELRMLKKDGMAFWTLMQITAEQDIDGVSVCRIVISDISNKKEAEEDLRENQAQFRRLFNEAPIGAAIVSLNYRFLVVNEELCRITGYLAKELTSLSFCDITHPDDLTDDINKTRQLEADEIDHFNMDKRYLRPDGSVVWISLSVRLIRNRNGRATNFLAMMIDINDRKRAEEALRDSEQRFSQVLNGLDALVYVADMKTYEIVFINTYGKNMWGDIKGKICWQAIQADQAGPCEFCTNSMLIGPDGNPTESVVWEFQNTVNKRWYNCRDRAIYWPDGRIVRMEIATDNTERKLAEMALQASEERYRTLVENASDMVYRTDENGCFTFVNPATLRITGYEEEDIIGKHYKMMVRPDMFKEAITFFANQLIKKIKNTYYEYPIITKDGHELWIGQNLQLIMEDSHVTGFQAVARDITEHKKAEAAIRKLNEELEKRVEERTQALKESQEQIFRASKLASLGQLAAGAAHEINNPLAVIIGFTEAMLLDLKNQRLTPDKIARNLGIVLKNTERCRTNVGNLLNFSMTKKSTTQETDINSLLNIALSLVEYKTTTQNIKVVKRYGEGLGKVNIDRNQMMQVFVNVVNNAQNAMPDKGKLLIRTWLEDDFVGIEFKDTGIGIEKENLSKVFDPFFSTYRPGKGVGLGLSVSYSIIERHEGSIEVKSDGKDKGASFIIKIPLWRKPGVHIEKGEIKSHG